MLLDTEIRDTATKPVVMLTIRQLMNMYVVFDDISCQRQTVNKFFRRNFDGEVGT